MANGTGARPPHGLLLLDKDEGISSFRAVRRARALLGGPRCGHAGSLDPFATGLLPVGVGRATRLLRFVAEGRKAYRATVRFGQATDTDDRCGAPLGAPRPPPGEAEVRAALPEFVGEIAQRPPAYSAKHVDGQRAYRLARAGRPAALPPAPVRVYELELVRFGDGGAELRCEVGPGVYVRALARDLGDRLGCGAHLSALRRTGVGPFAVEDAIRLPALRQAGPEAAPLLDPLAALAGMERLVVEGDGLVRLRSGRAVPFDEAAPAAGEAADAAEVGSGRPRAAVRRWAEDERAEDRRAGEAGAGFALVAVVTAVEGAWRPLVVWETG